MKRKIEDILNTISVRDLDESEKKIIWNNIQANLKTSSKSISLWLWVKSRPLIQKATALSLIFGMTATSAWAADSARPGDLLFPLDQAIEKIQLTLATSDSKRDELQLQFALERVEEVQQILEEVTLLGELMSPESQNIRYIQEETLDTAEEIPVPESAPVMESSPEETMQESDTFSISVDSILPTTTPALSMVRTSTTSSSTIFTASTTVAGKLLSSTTPVSLSSTNTPDILPPELSSLSIKDKERIELALETALEYLGEVKSNLSVDTHEDTLEIIDGVMQDLNSHIGSLPEHITFTLTVENNDNVHYGITETGQTSSSIEVTPEEATIVSEAPVDKTELVEIEIQGGVMNIKDTNEPESTPVASSTKPEAMSSSSPSTLLNATNTQELTTNIHIDAGEEVGTFDLKLEGDISALDTLLTDKLN